MPKRTLEADFLKAIGVEPRVGEPGVDITRRIYLVGFMGCGKSTVGAALAKRLRWQFVDLDRAIEERVGLPVHKIFLKYGEGHFRTLEFETIREVANEPGRAVVALGGGAYMSEVNRATVAKTGVVVWLDVPFRVMVARIAAQKKRRPLAQSRDQLLALYRSRLPFYHEADIRLRAGDQPEDRVARAALRLVRDDWEVVAERRRLQL